jgi:hypothetical protein
MEGSGSGSGSLQEILDPDLDPGGPNTYGSYGSYGSKSGNRTLVVCRESKKSKILTTVIIMCDRSYPCLSADSVDSIGASGVPGGGQGSLLQATPHPPPESPG